MLLIDSLFPHAILSVSEGTCVHISQNLPSFYLHNCFLDPISRRNKSTGLEFRPFIVITTRIRGAIHTKKHRTPWEPTYFHITYKKKTMKTIHHIAIKYLTYLVLHKRKLDNKQKPPPLHIVIDINIMYYYFILFHTFFYKQEPTHRKVGSTPHPVPRGFLSMVGPTGSNARRIARRCFFFFFFIMFSGPLDEQHWGANSAPGREWSWWGTSFVLPWQIITIFVNWRILKVSK